jgi:hypothetical protein
MVVEHGHAAVALPAVLRAKGLLAVCVYTCVCMGEEKGGVE